ncbi:4-hydroxyphenylacetate 3-hydroxylase N-terminal domain-containing protein [Pseudonocardia pini]|uniref:4-hydroxyphenylacetate 3-hydroxylase N-terminal domain-containing protein n=1 Tax=Pseudonocardia pini TaxID=2758030 RepID=UPI0015EFDF74|nr:4-hydroxyphenylacetate 3-hydroxylase N-terminal domain-containing protein [Pseudonocardia pini]
MKTGEDYLASIDDGRKVWFEGELVERIADHPILGQSAKLIAEGYDKVYDPTGDHSPFSDVPTDAAGLREHIDFVHDMGMLAHVTYTSIMTLLTAAGRIMDSCPEEVERINAFVERARAEDLRITQCITDAKGHRKVRPGAQEDPDSYVHVVERREDGVVLRGAKLHITAASLGHELMVIPTKGMKPGEEDYAIACMIPVNAPGVKIVDVSYAPRASELEDFPVSGPVAYPESFVILDDVFVPTERIFLDGQVKYATVFAHSLGLWERLGGLSSMADGADLLVGLSQLIAQANGTESVAHVRDKIDDMIIQATLIRASLEAAITHCHVGDNGAAFPDELYTNAGKYYAASNYDRLVQSLHDIAGGSIVTAPSLADLRNPEIGPAVRKYMQANPEIDGEVRLRLFHLIRDISADTYGGWKLVTNIQAGGGLYAQKIVTRKWYPMEAAVAKAKELVGVPF